jgi:hypothetical protein
MDDLLASLLDAGLSQSEILAIFETALDNKCVVEAVSDGMAFLIAVFYFFLDLLIDFSVE